MLGGPDTERVPVCPVCGHQLQTLDLPCPSCAIEPPREGNDALQVREFSQTLHSRRVIRYRPQEFVDQVNSWLNAHPGIVGINAVIHRDREGVRSITFTCRAVLDPQPLRVQMECIPLRSSVGRRLHQDPGAALSAWSDANPQARRLNHWIYAASGNASEVWVMYVAPADTLSLHEGLSFASIEKPSRLNLAGGRHSVALLLMAVDLLLAIGFISTLSGSETGATLRNDLLVTGAAIVVATSLVFVLLRRPRVAPRPKSKE